MKAAGPLLAVALAKLNLPQQPQPAMACSQVWERSGLHFQPFLPVVFWSFFFFFLLHSYKCCVPTPWKKSMKRNIKSNQAALVTVCKGTHRGKWLCALTNLIRQCYRNEQHAGGRSQHFWCFSYSQFQRQKNTDQPTVEHISEGSEWSHVSQGPGMGEWPPSYGASVKGKNVLGQQHGLKAAKDGALCHLHAAGRPVLSPLQVQPPRVFAGPRGPLCEKSTGRRQDCSSWWQSSVLSHQPAKATGTTQQFQFVNEVFPC